MQSLRRAFKRAVASNDDLPSIPDTATGSSQQPPDGKRIRKNNDAAVCSTNKSVDQHNPITTNQLYEEAIDAVISSGRVSDAVDDMNVDQVSDNASYCGFPDHCSLQQELLNVLEIVRCQKQTIDSINCKLNAVLQFMGIQSTDIDVPTLIQLQRCLPQQPGRLNVLLCKVNPRVLHIVHNPVDLTARPLVARLIDDPRSFSSTSHLEVATVMTSQSIPLHV